MRPARVRKPKSRAEAMDQHIDLGRAIVGPVFFSETAGAAGPQWHTAVPTHGLASLLGTVAALEAEAGDLHEINRDLRRQRDEARDRYNALLALMGYAPAYARPA